ncbi:MAG: sugar ABC transporter substrate-binding protein [Streptococcaceae bacterium]|jgi:multiple sugar transport system substrate-binding protein|nr:sugar ABC transporter substrate-binding protein [Streptococcaceae bacterium]
MKIRKIALGVTGLMATVALLSACSSSKSSSTSGKVEIKIATWAGADEAKQFDKILATLNSKSKDYKITQTVIPGSDYYTKIQTMIAGQKAPDLMWLSQEYIPAYASKGALVDLTSDLKAQKTVNMSDYFSASLDTAKYSGKTYGLPWISQPYVIYYNKTDFDKASISKPSLTWTWTDFEKAATTLTTNGIYGYANDGTLPLAVPVWGEGGDIWSSSGKAAINSSEAEKGLQQLSDISTQDKMTMPYAQASASGATQAFVQGKVDMIVGGANDDIEKQVKAAGGKFEVGMAVMPAGTKKQVTFSYVASTVVSSQTKNKAIAEEAMEDVTNAMFDWKVPAPVKSAQNKLATINPDKSYATDVIQKSMEIARGFNNLPQSADLNNSLWNKLWLPVISNNNGKGSLDIKASAESTQKEFENILSKK